MAVGFPFHLSTSYKLCVVHQMTIFYKISLVLVSCLLLKSSQCFALPKRRSINQRDWVQPIPKIDIQTAYLQSTPTGLVAHQSPDHSSKAYLQLIKFLPILKSVVDPTVLGGMLAGGLHAITGKCREVVVFCF